MNIQYRNLDETKAYASLASHTPAELHSLLTADRVERCSIDAGGGLEWNYAATPLDGALADLLSELAAEQQLIDKYQAIAGGEVMNPGEGRMVLHHLCRGELAGAVVSEGRNLREFYEEQRRRYSEFAVAVRSGQVTAPNGERFTTVVQVGIGGSDLGPRALYLALEGLHGGQMQVEFISNVDPDDAGSVLARIDPKRTLFVLVSKSGTTQETLTNEAFVVRALADAGITEPRKQIVCVTSESSPLAKSSDYLDSFFIDDYIGGRYSSSSAVGGVVLSLAYGPEVMAELLAGANEADRAALAPALHDNAALADALLGLYYRNVLGYGATAVLPYSQALLRFPAHLQQLDMESNGKRVNRDGRPLSYSTGPVIFGEPGTNGQHSFYQLLHQGTDITPLQFVGFEKSQRGVDVEFDGSSSQRKLNANLAAQIVAFALGKDDQSPNKVFPGGRPSTVLSGQRLAARSLGALLAHFENKVMFQGLAWNINSFDQEGVQLGKVLTKQVLGSEELNPVLAAYARTLHAR